MSGLPGPLRLTPSFPFAGRARELRALAALVPRDQDEGLRLALIGGEAGSGKSRLVRELANGAAVDGALVLYGACDSVVRLPYGPFVDALSQLVRGIGSETLREAIGPGGGELSRLLPDLPDRVGELSPPPGVDPDTERHRLHGAVSDLLVAASREAPLMLVIEDAHWADTPTLLLLRHLARGASDARAPAGDHVSRHRSRGPRGAGLGAGRPAALGGSVEDAPRGAERRRGLGVRA